MSERDFNLYLAEILESGEAVKTYALGTKRYLIVGGIYPDPLS